MTADLDYKIVVASLNQVKWIVKMADDEGWNTGYKDAVTLHQVDPTGFFVGLLDGQPISCIAGVKYEHFAYIAYYIVVKEHRGKGYGLKIFQHAMNYLKDYDNIGLDAVIDQQSNYRKFGFKFEHMNLRCVGVIPKSETYCKNIIEAKKVSFTKLLEYEKRHHPGVRKYFLSSWLNIGTNHSVVYLDAGKNIQGFGAIRKSSDGYRIGPLFAEKIEYAEAIFRALVDSLDGCKVAIDIPRSNINAVKLMKKLNLETIFETVRMYTGQTTGVDLNTIYSLLG